MSKKNKAPMPYGNGNLEPDEDCVAALELIESGWNESQGALFFEMTPNVSFMAKQEFKLIIYSSRPFIL